MYKKIIFEALEKVVTENGYMVGSDNRDIHEQSLSHRLAYYLENSEYFKGYNIDCEYNRYEEKSKRNSSSNLIKPDIVIHTRGIQNNNHIIIQTKKFNDPDKEIKKAQEDLMDDMKHLKYDYAYLVIFPKEQNFELNDTILKI